MKIKLIGIFICMLLIGTVLPASGTSLIDKTTSSNMSGNTLYVGGSGPNNYTKIQDAIEDAVVGDIVYVFDDSSPYYENLVIDVSINLIGDDKYTTIIDGNENEEGEGDVICIKADGVTVQGFTIQNGSLKPSPQDEPHCGIEIRSHNNIIKDNIIIDNNIGIQLGLPTLPESTFANNNVIEGNIVINNYRWGILLALCSYNNIKGNIISSNQKGVVSYYRGWNNVITYNNISSNKEGIHLAEEKNSIIQRNAVSGNELGIQIWHSKYYKVYENNIFDNIKDAYIDTDIIYYILHLKENLWDSNYWGQSIQPPVNIPGRFWLFFVNIVLVNILGLDKFITFPFYRYDYNPASEPYDIGI